MSNTKKKAKKKKRNFRKIWLEVRGFKEWLQYDSKHPNKVSCKFCKKTLGASFSTLKDHAMKNQYHLLLSGQDEPPKDSDFIIPAQIEREQERKKIELELKFLSMCTKANVCYENIPVVLNELKEMDESGVWKDLKMGKTKAQNMIINVIGEGSREDLAKILSENLFSICIDESTDIGKEKSLAIIVRYIDPSDYHVYSKHWDMVSGIPKR